MLYSEIRYYLSIVILALSAYLIYQVYIKPSEMDSSDVLGAFINSIESHVPIAPNEVCSVSCIYHRHVMLMKDTGIPLASSRIIQSFKFEA